MIYTAVTGGKDKPRTDVKCFTKCDKFHDPVLNAKIYKVLSHKFIDDEWSVWIDGNLELKVSEAELIQMTAPKEVGVFTHPYRDNIYDEAEACIQEKKDKKETIEQYMAEQENSDWLGACFLIVRKNTPEVAQMNERWWAEITTGTRRDQLSFPKAFPRDKVKLFPLVNPHNNQYFTRKAHLK